MSETISIRSTNRQELYEELLPQIRALLADESNVIAQLANVSAALKQAFPAFSWAGFYLRENDELVLGPFQGKPACVRIPSGKGVCGTAFMRKEPVIVPDVHAFPGHIACDPESRSEIVVPILDGDRCYGVIDIDSRETNSFDEVDAAQLTAISSMLIPYFRKALPDGE